MKNTIISTTTKEVFFVGKTFTGHHHDYTMFKTEFDPQQEWFKNLTIYVDLGYQGIKNDYSQGDIQIPIKKPRRSKANPSPSLTPEEKAFNQSVSKARIVVENAICGMKRYNILVDRFRNHCKSFENSVIAIVAALWNFNLNY